LAPDYGAFSPPLHEMIRMKRPPNLTSGAVLFVALVALAGTAKPGLSQVAVQSSARSQSDLAAMAKAREDSIRRPYTAADVHFMSGMIGHHAQAIVMAGWASSHGAGPSVHTLCDRIINAQRDEIRSMQQWLRDRQLPVPEASAKGMKMVMDGVEHEMLMPGMLTEEQMKELDAARGKEFDKLFLKDMIQHHQGAVQMVKKLFDSYGAAQDDLVFKFASDVNVDQTTEIARMEKMLVAINFGIEQH
ncbi:MAG TPA: DUF305 domain-containing protein, partial [Gemmatimonadaceae bacterium]|nr:DUF305 domain-containing protein [Gemmatimonadaceae bacterium]